MVITEKELIDFKATAWDSLAEEVWDLEMHNDHEKNMMDCHDFVAHFQALDEFLRGLTWIKKEEK